MTPVSHALLPVLLGRRWIPKKHSVPCPRVSAAVALCGALPDILSPHLSLDARYTALSHTVWAWLIFGALILILHGIVPKIAAPSLAALCICAYGGHIFCDLITGGVSLLYPLNSTVQGENYLPYWLWITCDGILILYLYVVYRWLPLRKRIRERSNAASATMSPAG